MILAKCKLHTTVSRVMQILSKFCHNKHARWRHIRSLTVLTMIPHSYGRRVILNIIYIIIYIN